MSYFSLSQFPKFDFQKPSNLEAISLLDIFMSVRFIRNVVAFRSVVLSAFVCGCIPRGSVFQPCVFTNYSNALWYSHTDYVK